MCTRNTLQSPKLLDYMNFMISFPSFTAYYHNSVMSSLLGDSIRKCDVPEGSIYFSKMVSGGEVCPQLPFEQRSVKL